MTRGQLSIISPEGKILTSTEFNGEMQFDGNGRDAYERLDSIDHVEEYADMLCEFNDDHYENEERIQTYQCNDNYLDMSKNYYDKWGSDYVYIKNISDDNLTMQDAKGNEIPLNAGITSVFHLGKFVGSSLQDFETWSLSKKQNSNNNEVSM